MTHLTGEQELICECLRRGDSLPVACRKTGIPIAYYRKKYLEPDGVHTNWQSTSPGDIGQSWPELPRRKWEPSDKTTYTFYVSGIVTDDKRYLWPGDLELMSVTPKDRELVSSLRYALEREHEPEKIANLKKQLVEAQKKVVMLYKPWIQTVPEIKVCNAPPPNLEAIRWYARKKYAGNETVLNNSPAIFGEVGGMSSDLEGEITEFAYRYSGQHLHKHWKRILEDAHTNNDRIKMAEYDEETTNAHRYQQRYGRQTPSRGNSDEKTKIISEILGKTVSYNTEGSRQEGTLDVSEIRRRAGLPPLLTYRDEPEWKARCIQRTMRGVATFAHVRYIKRKPWHHSTPTSSSRYEIVTRENRPTGFRNSKLRKLKDWATGPKYHERPDRQVVVGGYRSSFTLGGRPNAENSKRENGRMRYRRCEGNGRIRRKNRLYVDKGCVTRVRG